MNLMKCSLIRTLRQQFEGLNQNIFNESVHIYQQLKSQMNLNQSLMQISKKDQDFEQNIRKIFCVAQEAKLFPGTTDENRGLFNVFTNQVASPQVKEGMLGLFQLVKEKWMHMLKAEF